MNQINFIHGINDKPIISQELEKALSAIPGISGECFFGYPLPLMPEGKYIVDAILVSPEKGIIVFDLVDDDVLRDYKSKQNDLFNKTESLIRLNKNLVKGRNIIPPLNIITFAQPYVLVLDELDKQNYPFSCNEETLKEAISRISWGNSSEKLYKEALSGVESFLAKLEHWQAKIAFDLTNNAQYIPNQFGIRNALSLKAAYLHMQYPKWKIAIITDSSFNKELFQQLVYGFSIKLNGEEPDWSKIQVNTAEIFERMSIPEEYYDMILINLSQEIRPDFLDLCYERLKSPKRMIYSNDKQWLENTEVKERLFRLLSESDDQVNDHSRRGYDMTMI